VAADIPEAKGMLPGIFGRMLTNPSKALSGFEDFELGSGTLPKPVRDMIESMVGDRSVGSAPVSKRIMIAVIRGKKPEDLAKTSGLIGVSDNSTSERLAKAYALYKLATCMKLDSADELRNVVLHNYCQ
jgi:hypothetical protein